MNRYVILLLAAGIAACGKGAGRSQPATVATTSRRVAKVGTRRKWGRAIAVTGELQRSERPSIRRFSPPYYDPANPDKSPPDYGDYIA